MTVLSFDELNKADGRAVKTSSKKAIPYKEYFSVMGLSKKEIELRTSLALGFEEAILFLYALRSEGASPGLASNELMAELLNSVGSHTEIDDYVEEISKQYADDLAKSDDVSEDDQRDQAQFIAEDMANAYANYIEYKDAKASGKTHKKWITENDNRVRPTHQDEEGMVIPIDDTFLVGGSVMRFPKDTYYGASDEEIIRCRCKVEYQ